MGFYKVYLKITIKVLSEESGRNQETIRRNIKAGKLDPYSLESIRTWMGEHSKQQKAV